MINIGCSVEGCNEPVIGQCQGHKEPCGRFFCRKHSKGRLCDECAAIVEQEKIYNDYCATSQYVKGKASGFKAFGIGFLLFGIIYTALLYITKGIISSAESTGDPRFIITTILVITLAISLTVIFTKRILAKSRTKRLDEVKATRMDFESFYNAWASNERKKALASAGKVALGIVVGAVAYGLSNEASVARDVRRISNRLDQM
jgi:hypothetical protein